MIAAERFIHRPQLEMPFMDRIPLEAREYNRSKKAVARHEIKHFLAGYGEGLTMSKLSVKPGAGYLGITEFSGVNSLESFQVAAMGSTIKTSGSRPAGTGSDESKAHMIAFHTGIPVEHAADKAARHIKSWSDEEQDLVAEYVAILGEVDQSEILELRVRAQMELAYNKSRGKEYVVEELDYEHDDEGRNIYAETRIFDDKIQIVYIAEEKKQQQELICSECKETGQHKEYCKNQERITPQTPSLPRQGVIFGGFIRPHIVNPRSISVN